VQWPPMPDPGIYESWGDLNPKDALPKRSYLYHLQPVAVDSAYVESLTGYIARLAEAHCVATGALLALELRPCVPVGSGVTSRKQERPQNSTFIYDAHILNGLGECPRQWVRVLESLTGRVSLDTLTMLKWRHVFSNCDLLRRVRAWCPHCYYSWRNASQPVYEPLLWNICAVTVCQIHGRPLQRCCPHCTRESPLLTSKARPGYCYRCRAWLGVGVQRERADCVDNAELRIASAVGELLALGSAIRGVPSGTYFKENLMCCIRDLTDGNQSAFSRTAGVSLDALTRWLNPNTTFSLRPFLRMCCALRISPSRILTERIPAGDPEWEHARDLYVRHNSHIRPSRPASQVRRTLEDALNSKAPISLRQVTQQLGYRSMYTLRRYYSELCDKIQKKYGNICDAAPPHAEPYAHITHEMARKALERAIRDSQPRSLSAICKEIGYRNDSSLYHRFPEHCSVLVAKHREWRSQKDRYVQDVINKALDEQPIPTLKEVAGRLGMRPHVLRSRFRKLCAALVARRPERLRLEREHTQKQLEAALKKNPAPPMQAVAQSLGRNQAHLGTVFPDLYEKIKRRHLDHRRTVRSEQRLQFLAQVRKAVIDLCERCINPSRKNVIAVIENPSLKWTQVLDRYIAQTLREMEAESRTCSNK
jgi:AraC-like DNA-binding protein